MLILKTVVGDWFELTYCLGRWELTRVIAWGLLDDDEDNLRAYTSDGNGVPVRDRQEFFHLVFGNDLSPMGPTWNEIYRDAHQSSHTLSRCVTDVIGTMIVPISY